MPDVAFLVGGYAASTPAHEPYGPLVFAPTLGLALYVVADRAVAPALRRGLPERWARLFVTRGLPASARGWAWVVVALVAGAITHVALDGFTHHWMWPARALYADWYAGPVRVTRVLQWVASIGASIGAIAWARRRIAKCPPTVEVPGWGRRLAIAVAIGFAGAAVGLGLGLLIWGRPATPHDYATLLCPMADVALVAAVIALRRFA